MTTQVKATEKVTEQMEAAYAYARNHFTTGEGKPLFIVGPPGTGKTTLFESLRDDLFKNENGGKSGMLYRIKTAQDLADMYSAHPDDGGGPLYFTRVGGPLVIDDVLAEGFGIHYGNKLDVVADLITRRYKSKEATYFTSNAKNKAELRARYGDRIMDRLEEMCTFMIMDGESMRK